jgi:hypothetical protein
MARVPGQSDPVTLPRATLSSAALFQTGVTFLVQLPMEKHSEETPMKTLLSIIAFSLIVAVAAPAFAGGTPKTQADCEKAHMKWDATAKKCS